MLVWVYSIVNVYQGGQGGCARPNYSTAVPTTVKVVERLMAREAGHVLQDGLEPIAKLGSISAMKIHASTMQHVSMAVKQMMGVPVEPTCASVL